MDERTFHTVWTTCKESGEACDGVLGGGSKETQGCEEEQLFDFAAKGKKEGGIQPTTGTDRGINGVNPYPP